MLEQINGSLGLQREMLEKQNAKTVVEQEVVPSLERLTKMVEMQGARLKLVEAKEAAARDPMASKWDRGSGDDTPSPPRTTSNVRCVCFSEFDSMKFDASRVYHCLKQYNSLGGLFLKIITIFETNIKYQVPTQGLSDLGLCVSELQCSVTPS